MSDTEEKALAAQAELKRAADAAFAEYRRVEASAGVEHKRAIADALADAMLAERTKEQNK
jgi:hypothetical protein